MESRPTPVRVLGKADTLAALNQLVDEARQHLWLVSPQCSFGALKDLARRVGEALERRVKVTLVVRRVGDGELRWTAQDIVATRALMEKGLDVFEVADLQARAYYSEAAALVTSLNLVEGSFDTSIDVGVLMPGESPQYAQLRECLRSELRAMFQLMDAERLALGAPPPDAKVAPGLRRRRRLRQEDATDRALHLVLREGDACHRCGRTGHWALECYARTDIHGVRLDAEEG